MWKSQKLVPKGDKRGILCLKEEGKHKVKEGLLAITLLDTEKINKYHEEELKKQRKTFEKGKAKKISREPKMKDLENPISNLRESEIKDNLVEGM